jgi:hypothetical protein
MESARKSPETDNATGLPTSPGGRTRWVLAAAAAFVALGIAVAAAVGVTPGRASADTTPEPGVTAVPPCQPGHCRG